MGRIRPRTVVAAILIALAAQSATRPVAFALSEEPEPVVIDASAAIAAIAR